MDLVRSFLLDQYLVIKALHIISVIAWMAGLLYLPRLFVYHAGLKSGQDASALLKVMERRLLVFIMRPAMIASWGFAGLMVLADSGLLAQGWVHAKLLLVVLLTGAHHAMAAWQKKFAADRNKKSDKFYRVVNEVPTVLMIFIVFLVILKPF